MTETTPEPSGRSGSTPARGPRRAWVRRVTIAATGFVILCLLAAGAVIGYARYRYDQIHKVDIGPASAGSSPTGTMNILLAGDNCRACLNGKQANAFGTGAQVGGGRSDVTMVLHLDIDHNTASLLSIPRDMFLPIPGTNTANRIDDALNNGPKALVQEIEDDLGIPIDHYVSVNFDTFQTIINDLGGISMYFPTELKDAYSALNVTQTGCVHLDGFQALAVVRARHLYYQQNGRWEYDGFGDLSRIKRDHVFLQVMATQVEHQLTNPLKLNSIVGDLAPQLEVDSGLSLGTMISLVRQFRSINPATVPTYTLPIVVDANNYFYKGSDYGSVVFPAYPQDAQVIAQFEGKAPAAPHPAGVTVRVLNGSGQYNQATKTGEALSSLGYTVTGTGDTTIVGNPAETIVYYVPGHANDAVALAGQLTGPVAVGPMPGSTAVITGGSGSSGSAARSTPTTVSPASTVLPVSGSAAGAGSTAASADITVVTGTQLLVSTPAPPTSSTTSTTKAPSKSSTTTV
ncbi:MAG TPA: LCP family protein, partial [Acidimicrobiales bacterium]|nr:LCP family protein [Acidimicrobiales bacterium]